LRGKLNLKKNFIWLFVVIVLPASLLSCARSTNSILQKTPAFRIENATKTLIPTRANLTQQLTPSNITVLVTTRMGQELTFETFRVEPNEYVSFHTEALPQGLPMASGVEISYDYISQVDFGQSSADWDSVNPAKNNLSPQFVGGVGTWPVTVTLTDGTQIRSSLGFKAHHQLHFTGTSNYGYLDFNLADVQKLAIRRISTPVVIPKEPSGSDLFNVHTTQGDTIRVTSPKIFTICMYEVYCCYEETLKAIPIQGGKDVLLNELKTISFTTPEAIALTFLDGKGSQATIRPSTACPDANWRLRGKAALGDYEIELGSVKSIERSTQ
jgi:hypothetical protein